MTTTPDYPPLAESETVSAPIISGRARTIALICLLSAAFMELMDGTVVNVALRTMETDLGASSTALQWVVAGYPLAYAVGLIVSARLGDRYGRRLLFVAGLAAGPGQLVAFRVLQGAAAALMVPQVLTNIQVLYRPDERGKAMGMFTSVIGLAAVTGPILGAVITDGDWFGMSWRPIFLINVPLAAIAVAAALSFIPETRDDNPAPITAGSAGLLGASLAAIMLPITLGPDNNWPAWGFATITIGVAGLAIFARRQVTTAEAGVTPMVPPTLFRTRSFTTGLITFAALTIPTGGYFLVQSLHVQMALGWSVLHTGFMWIPFSLAVPVSAGLAATVLAPRLGRRILQIGAAILITGMAAMYLAEGSSNPGLWFPVALVIAGLGFGAIVGSAGLLVLNDVPVALAGAASGVFNTVQALAVAVGAAVIGTAYTTVGESHGLQSGYHVAFLTMMAIVGTGAVLAQTMPKVTTAVSAG